MKNSTKKIAAIVSTAAAFALTGCATGITVTFETERPWHSGELSYEQLDYAVSIYDYENGADSERTLVADGTLGFTLNEKRADAATVGYTSLDMAFSVTYNNSAAEADRGKTDTITSSTEFQTDSLVTSTMTKTVALADRENVTNLSYTVTADYFGEKKTTRTYTATNETASLDIPTGSYYDNEMMFFLARATAISEGSSVYFTMTAPFDAFINNKLQVLNMVVATKAETAAIDVGDFVSGYGVEATTAEDGAVSYPVKCYETSISKSATKSGPPYVVYYSATPFTIGGKEHKKIPVKISYTEYNGNKVRRVTEYTLTGCAFDRE